KRECKRFVIPGATVSYEHKKGTEEFSQIVDMSRAGIKYQSDKSLDLNSELTLKISIPGETIPLILIGHVRWITFDKKKKKYLIGIQFNPYGEKSGQNYPGNLGKIIALEQKFSTLQESKSDKYEIDIE
ncbi:MAG: PilZ domain-containing protein, partial [Candidatus Aminicenantes bacterium]|nr:PilZ domain-containing protein [Candidatus Aminicenantes bacterium]